MEAMWMSRRYTEVIHHADEAIAYIGNSHDYQYHKFYILTSMAQAHALMGAHEEAEEALRKAMDCCQKECPWVTEQSGCMERIGNIAMGLEDQGGYSMFIYWPQENYYRQYGYKGLLHFVTLEAALNLALCLGHHDRKWESEECLRHAMMSQNHLETLELRECFDYYMAKL